MGVRRQCHHRCPPRQFIRAGNGPTYCPGAVPAGPLNSNGRQPRQVPRPSQTGCDRLPPATAPAMTTKGGTQAATDTGPVQWSSFFACWKHTTSPFRVGDQRYINNATGVRVGGYTRGHTYLPVVCSVDHLTSLSNRR